MLHLQEIKSTIKEGVELVAVSKYHSCEAIQAAYNQGQRIFGESRVQELQIKQEKLPKDIKWHFIGHLQTNKVKYIVPYISLIHTVDNYKLLEEINKQAEKVNRKIPCLLELHLAQETTKFGFTTEECTEMLMTKNWQSLHGIEITGIMCMASNTSNTDQIRMEFHKARTYFDFLKERFFSKSTNFCHRSYGMSHDYPIAMEEGATLVRIGTAIFGERD